MSATPFRLTPFAPTTEALNITGTLAIVEGEIVLDYLVEGDLTNLHLPRSGTSAERRDLLWQTTCLELFVALVGRDDYWEFNLSPAGHWNVYHLERYREGLTPEPAYRQLPMDVALSTQALSLRLRCPLPPPALVPTGPGLDVGITAVIDNRISGISYWALQHPATEPDFHHRGGFCIKLP